MSNPDRKFSDTDDPSSAPESGDPKTSGRSQGRIIDNTGAPAGRRDDNKGGDRDYESGRHGTK